MPLGVRSPAAPSLGNLRCISRKAWSKSPGDLRQTLSMTMSLDPSFPDKVQQSELAVEALLARPDPPPLRLQASNNGRSTFPTVQTSSPSCLKNIYFERRCECEIEQKQALARKCELDYSRLMHHYTFPTRQYGDSLISNVKRCMYAVLLEQATLWMHSHSPLRE